MSSAASTESILYAVGQPIYFNDAINGWSQGVIQTIISGIADKRGFIGGCGTTTTTTTSSSTAAGGPDGCGVVSRYRLHASDTAVASVIGYGRSVREIQPTPTASQAEMLSVAIIVAPSKNNEDYWTVVPVWLAVGSLEQGAGVMTVYDSILHPCLGLPDNTASSASASVVDPDLFRIDDLHISALSTQLSKRYETSGEQYSRLGPTILSVNPFETKPFNSISEREKYLDQWKNKSGPSNPANSASSLPPHVWSVAEKAYSGAIFNNSSSSSPHQSVVISGESGSGKTENTKMIIDFLGCLSSLHSCNAAQQQLASDVSSFLKASNPILELFGNAKTVRNDNSSRFGKYTKLWFNKKSGVMIGAEMETYLLERSRVVSQGPGERNYHIFYGLVAALRAPPSSLSTASQPHLKKVLQCISAVLGGGGGGAVPGPEGYRLLQQGGEYSRRGVDGRSTVDELSEFKMVQQALTEMGVSDVDQGNIWNILGAIMLFAEVTFVTSESTGKAAIEGLPTNDLSSSSSLTNASLSVRAFVSACDLLGLKHKQDQILRECFLEKSKSTILTTMSTASEASDLRDALCKHLYVSLFDYLVQTVNSKLAPSPEMMDTDASSPTSSSSTAVYVGVLDIFGFECFKKNGFEQLCINYANEALQGHYNAFTFAADEEECAAEGIPCAKVNYPDNTSCLTLFNLKKVGIFDTLDEESGFKGGTAERYTQCLWDRFGNPAQDTASAAFVKPKGTNPTSFSVKHFASTVTYETGGWVSRNADSMKDECVNLLATSQLGLLATMMTPSSTHQHPAGAAGGGPPKRKLTVSKYFRSQLEKLMSELRSTSSHFIRCIKPNTSAKARLMDIRYTCLQLESAGVVQTIALKRQGFAVRRPLVDFEKQFWPLIQSRVFRGRAMVAMSAAQGGACVRAGTASALLAACSYCLNWDPSPSSLSARRTKLRSILTEELRTLPLYIRDKRSLPAPVSDWLLLQHGGKRIPTTSSISASPPLFTTEEIEAIVLKLAPEGPYYAVGKTKYFFKESSWGRLERLLRRWKRRCLSMCLPLLRRWVVVFRKAKAKQEADRLAALRDLQQIATQRRNQEASGGGGVSTVRPISNNITVATTSSSAPNANTAMFLRDVGRGSSLPVEKQAWFEEVAVVFRNFDLPVLLDVVYNLNSQDKVVRALTEMQAQRLNATLPGTLLRLFQDLGISTSVAENFAANGVSSVNDLAALPRGRLLGYGLTPKQVGAVMNRMMGQQGELLINERLRVACLDVGNKASSLPNIINPTPRSAGPHYTQTGSRSYADGERALPPTPDSTIPPTRGGEGLHTALAAARTDARTMLQDNEDAKVQRMTELGIASRQVCYAALGQCDGDVQKATAFILDGRVPRDSQIGAVRRGGGVTSSSPPWPHHPPSTRPQPPLVAAGVDPAKLKYLTDMGFRQEEASDALLRCKNDANAALERCIGNS